MIGELYGTVSRKGAGFIILSVGGVGYQLYITAETYQKLEAEEEVRLYTHLAVREDSLTLFGFMESEELRLFEMLISVSGIGPKSGLAILSLTDVRTLSSAIAAGESAYLTKVSGIGRKVAGKIILELKDKLGATIKDAAGEHFSADSDALEALETLGYSVRDGREALKQISPDISGTEERLKEALKLLGKR